MASRHRSHRIVAALWIGAVLLLAVPAQAAPGIVKAAKFQMKGWLTGPGGNEPVKLQNDYWINLIRSRPRGSAVPKNEVLVAWLACSNDPGLELASQAVSYTHLTLPSVHPV